MSGLCRKSSASGPQSALPEQPRADARDATRRERGGSGQAVADCVRRAEQRAFLAPTAQPALRVPERDVAPGVLADPLVRRRQLLAVLDDDVRKPRAAEATLLQGEEELVVLREVELGVPRSRAESLDGRDEELVDDVVHG